MENKIIIVTRGTRGIGRAVSKKFLKEEYKVLALSTYNTSTEKVLKEKSLKK